MATEVRGHVAIGGVEGGGALHGLHERMALEHM